jgi:hypothetical protein
MARLLSRTVPTVLLFALVSFPALAYTPGTGNVFNEDFDGELDPDWEMGNGINNSPSPWTQQYDDGDYSFMADGYGPNMGSPTRHWARRALHPTTATSFSVAFEYWADLGEGYSFQMDLEQRAPTVRKYRMIVDGDGAVTLWRTESGVFQLMASAGNRTIPPRKTRWVRFGIEPGGAGQSRVGVRIWTGSATSEPTGWTLEFLDDLDTLQRVNRFEFEADGPPGVGTLIDDMDVFGDAGSGVASSVTHIYLTELSHLDIGFTEPPDDIETFAKTHLDQVLDNVEADPGYRWYVEAGWWLDRWWERSGQASHDRMIDALRSGQIELGASYANQTTTMLGHEELARNVYWSSRFAREHAVPVRAWITDDVPGSSFAVPEIIARSGMDYYLGGMNCGFGGQLTEPDHGDRPFWWVGPDGSRVLSWVTFDSYAEAFQYGFSFFDQFADLYHKLGLKLPEVEEAGYPWPELLLFRGFDNHYQGFHARNLINQWNATYDTPVFHLMNPSEFLDMMLAKYGPTAFPEYSGDFGAAWARSRAGAQHTHAWIRQAHREARAAEALLAAGWSVDGEPFPQSEVDFLYRKLLESDEHTGAGGWAGYFTPEEMDRNNRIHLSYATDARDTAATLLEEGLDRTIAELSASGDAVVAVNPLGRARDGWTRIALPPEIYGTDFRVVDRSAGTETAYQRLDAASEILFRAESVPALGYRVFDLVPGEPTADPAGMLAVTATTLENDHYALTVDATDGSLASLIEKATGRELIDTASAYDFNELGYNTHQETVYHTPPHVLTPDSATTAIERDGPLVASIRVTRSGTFHVETVYRLYLGEDRVEIENVLDRDLMPYVPHSTGSELYFVTMPFDIHDFEIRTETTTRFLDPFTDGFQRSGLFDYHNVEHAMAIWDTDGGILYGVDTVAAHHFEALTSLTSSTFANGDALMLSRLYDKADEYEFRGGAIGPFTKEPGTPPILTYTHHIRGTGPSFDPVETSRFGFEAMSPIRARLIERRPGNLPDDVASFFTVDDSGVLPYTAKRAEIGDGVILRMTELTGTSTTARVTSDVLALSNPERVEQDEEGGTPIPMDGAGFLVDLGPYETATVRVQTAPAWSPIALMVDKNEAGSAVTLTWTDGVTPYTLQRAADATFAAGVTTLADEEDVNLHDDPVLHDGNTYYYLVK